eukprot:TRINITY_DN5561_c0_g1_i1.p1 TRINITY_DN5561_c0_g1~~TRINITY_DN5561_c0_g1_i1.p1  ORF type:complete len:1451 (+),score=491.58 TRINITY_DN5561_c0_g1_i1:45-4355(+)
MGKIHITVGEARRIPKSDAYVSLTVDDKTAKTSTVNSTTDPVWQKKFSFEIPSDYRTITLKAVIFDKVKIGNDNKVGSIEIPLSSFKDKEEKADWFSLTVKEKNAASKPEIYLRVLLDSKDETPILEEFNSEKASKGEVVEKLEEIQAQLLESRTENVELVSEINSVFGDIYYQFCNPRVMGNVDITIVNGRNLPKMDLMGNTGNILEGTSDPYCKIYCGGKLTKTSTKESNLNPDWNETFTMPVKHAGEEVVIDMYDKDAIGKDEFMGQVIIPLAHVINSEAKKIDNNYPLKPKKFASESQIKKVKGTMKVAISYTPEKEDSSKPEVVPVRRRADLIDMAVKVKENLLKRVADSNIETDKARQLIQDVEAIFRTEYFTWCEPRQVADLSVRVVEARNLAKADVVGSSDPYVVVEVDKQSFKTPVIKNNLNPKWDNQEFKLKLYTLGEAIDVAIYDKDDVGDDDHLGTALIPVSRIYNLLEKKDGTIKEWYSLGTRRETKKKDKGDLKISGEVCLEWTFKSVSENIPASPSLGKDAVLEMVTKVKTVLVDNIKSRDEEIAQERGFEASVASLLTSDYNELCNSGQEPVQFVGQDPIRNLITAVTGALKKQLSLRDHAVSEARSALRNVIDGVTSLYYTLCKPAPVANLDVTVLGARKLAKRDIIGTSDPYVTVQVDNNAKEQTPVIKNNLNPTWNTKFTFPITSTTATVELICWDWDSVGASDHLGSVYVPVLELVSGKEVDQWYPLGQKPKSSKKEDISGDLHLKFHYQPLAQSSEEKQEHGYNEILMMVEEIKTSVKQRIDQAEEQIKANQSFLVEMDSIFAKDYYTYCKPQKVAEVVVHVVEARGLTKKDIVGTSDPYVVVELEGQSHKTPVIKNNLNPKWTDARFSFDITRLTTNVNMTLYDWDATGSDDFLGFVTMPLTSTASNLSVVGATDGGQKTLDMWLAVGHRPTDPSDVTGELHVAIQFLPAASEGEAQPSKQTRGTDELLNMILEVRDSYHSQISAANKLAEEAAAFVTKMDSVFTPEYYQWCNPPVIAELHVQVVEAKDLIKADTFGSSDPYVVLEIENQKGQTNVINNNLNPKWKDQSFVLPLTKLTGLLYAKLWDHDAVGKNDPLGFASFSLKDILVNTLEGQKEYDVWGNLRWEDPKMNQTTPISGAVHLIVEFKPIKADEELKKEGQAYQQEVEGRIISVKDELTKRARESGLMFGKIMQRVEKQRPLALATIPDGNLLIKIGGARGVMGLDYTTGKSDPYCVVKVGKHEHKTKVVKNTCEPVWDVEYTIPIISVKSEILEVTVFDHDLIGRDDFLGYVSFPVSLFNPEETNKGYFKLQPYKKYKAKGEVYMEVTYVPKEKIPTGELLIDFDQAPEAEAKVELTVEPTKVLEAVDEVFRAYEEKVKILEAMIKGERAEKQRVSAKASSLAAKLTNVTLGK